MRRPRPRRLGVSLAHAVTAAVIFDLDGVLIDSEAIWDEVREAYVRDRGGRYDVAASHAMMGMSSARVVALHPRGARRLVAAGRRSTRTWSS